MEKLFSERNISVFLDFKKGVRYEEIADKNGISSATVLSIISRIQQRKVVFEKNFFDFSDFVQKLIHDSDYESRINSRKFNKIMKKVDKMAHIYDLFYAEKD